MTKNELRKLEKSLWRYQLHDDFGCIREFKEKDSALQWQSNRKDLKLIIVKPKKINIFEVTDNFDPFDIPF